MMLGYSLNHAYPLEHDVAYAPPMHEGYALFLEEGRYYTRLIIGTSASSFIVGFTMVVYTETGTPSLLVHVIMLLLCIGLGFLTLGLSQSLLEQYRQDCRERRTSL